MKDELILDFLKQQGAAGTWCVALMLNIGTPAARREMLRLEKKGLVVRDKYSSANNTVWAATPTA